MKLHPAVAAVIETAVVVETVVAVVVGTVVVVVVEIFVAVVVENQIAGVEIVVGLEIAAVEAETVAVSVVGVAQIAYVDFSSKTLADFLSDFELIVQNPTFEADVVFAIVVVDQTECSAD